MSDRKEHLKIVFRLGDVIETKEGTLGQAQVRIEKYKQPIEASEAISIFIDVLRSLDLPAFFQDDGRTIGYEMLHEKVSRKGGFHSLTCGDLAFEFGVVASKRHLYIRVSENAPGAARNWQTWTQPFLAMSGFVQAWVADAEYDLWQNVTDPKRFEMAGRSHGPFKLIDNGHRPPLNRMIIDISHNPGHWVLRDGYVEAIGATMWISGEFFALTKGEDNLAAVCGAEWLQIERATEGTIKLQAHSTAFSDESTAPIQSKLRALLYPA